MIKLSKKNEWREGIGQIEYGPLENVETLGISKEENAQHKLTGQRKRMAWKKPVDAKNVESNVP